MAARKVLPRVRTTLSQAFGQASTRVVVLEEMRRFGFHVAGHRFSPLA